MRRDIAVVVPADMEVQTLFNAMQKARLGDVRTAPVSDIRLFDLYRPTDGEHKDEKSLAFTLELVSTSEEALSEQDADAAVQGIVEALTLVGARLRS